MTSRPCDPLSDEGLALVLHFRQGLHPMLLFQPLPLPHTPFPALGLSVGAGLGSRACCCDLDFQAEMVPGADSQRALSLALPGRPPLGPSVWWHLGVQVEMFPANSFGGRASPAVWLIVCVCHGACQQGWFVYSGQSRGLGIRTSRSTLTIQCPWLCLSSPTTEARMEKNRFVKLAPLICQLRLRAGWCMGSSGQV